MANVIITAVAVVQDLKEVRLNKGIIATQMQAGWRDAGPHGSRTNSWPGRGHKRMHIEAQLGNTRNIEILRSRNEILALGHVRGPGAAIQDQGGTIPMRGGKGGRLMRFGYWGKWRFGRVVNESRIRPKQYIVRGLQRVKRTIGAVIEFVWVKRTI